VEQRDPYWKLREPPPTPADELCSCLDAPPVVLQFHFSSNPIVCIRCNLEVPPERLGFSAQLAEAIAFWRTFYSAFYYLWLDSREFESWAHARLSDPGSPPNKRGLELASQLNEHRRCYLWSFQDAAAEDFQPLSACPRCHAPLGESFGRLLCEPCSIVVAN
jgi:hypothetical protein